jgi:hypothetical protein
VADRAGPATSEAALRDPDSLADMDWDEPWWSEGPWQSVESTLPTLPALRDW